VSDRQLAVRDGSREHGLVGQPAACSGSGSLDGFGRDVEDLWTRYKTTGDQRARDELVIAYSPLVKYVAGRMSSGLPAHVEEADLISYGMGGLIGAIEKFDFTSEITFKTYAIPRIRGSIIDELRGLDWVPRPVRALARKIEQATQKLEAKLRRAPTDEEMAAELGMPVDEFLEALHQLSTSSIIVFGDPWNVSVADVSRLLVDANPDWGALDPHKLADRRDLRDQIASAIAALPEREKVVIALYYYEKLTLREVAEVLSSTEYRVSQLHTKALLRLRSELPNDFDDPTTQPD
jgi:RNA polymerase sigma factor for flagellar operon FliA